MNDKEFLSDNIFKELIEDPLFVTGQSTDKEINPRDEPPSGPHRRQKSSASGPVTSGPTCPTRPSPQTGASYTPPQYIHTASGDIPRNEWLKRRELEKWINCIDLKRKETNEWRIDEWRRAVSTPAGNPSASLSLIRLRKKLDEWTKEVDEWMLVLETWQGENAHDYKKKLEQWQRDLETWRWQLGM